MKQIPSFLCMERLGHGLALVLVLLAPCAAVVQAAAEPESASPSSTNSAGSSWLSEVQQRIQTSEYEITWQAQTVLGDLDQAWHAPNRAHNLRTYFTEDGVRVSRLQEIDPTWVWSLSLIGFGRRGDVFPVADARLLPHQNRMDYDRGPIVEWYVNDERGLEQGFTLGKPPEAALLGADASAPAFLVLRLRSSLIPSIDEGGRSIDFAAREGGPAVLHYSGLKVTDAVGTELSSLMEMAIVAGAREIRLVFDDTEALYPVTIDPVLTGPAWTGEGDDDYASFGYSVSTAGDVNGDGYADVIVGAPSYDNSEIVGGRAYVFHGSSSGLSTIADWTVSGEWVGAYFGGSVSTAGDVNGDGYDDVIIGAERYDNPEGNEGRAYVYYGSTSGLSTTPAWTAESNRMNSYFGSSVATAGDVNGDGYDDVIVGAKYYYNTDTHEGRAFVYHGSSSGLSATADWTAEGDLRYSEFGHSVSTAGDVNGDGYDEVIVGAPWYDDLGRVYIYPGSPTGLNTAHAWMVTSDQDDAYFGRSVSTAGDVNGDGYSDVIVGADNYSSGEVFPGRAFVFYGSASGLGSAPDWTADGNQDETSFGISVSTAGDVNGDGYSDVIVGGHYYDNGESTEGGAWVYTGSATGLSTTDDWSAEGDAYAVYFGYSVSTAGDVNGDGAADVIVGAYGHDVLTWNEGRAYVYHGSAAPVCNVPADEVYVHTMDLTRDGNDHPVLHFQDPNPPDHVTAYNIYRSPAPSLPHDQWSLFAHGVVDVDATEPDVQWIETSGETSPSGCWFYQVAAYNHQCPDENAEGPW